MSNDLRLARDMMMLSKAVYSDVQTINRSMQDQNPANDLLPPGWRVYKPHPEMESGFYACAFINDNTKEVAIAFRGSEANFATLLLGRGQDEYSNRDWEGPNLAIASLKPGWDPQFTEALDFTRDVLEQAKREHPDYQAIATGHSLGGALTQIVSKGCSVRGLAFDPPGAANVAASREFSEWTAANRVDGGSTAGAVTNYCVNGSIVSSTMRLTDDHIGKVVPVSGTDGPGDRFAWRDPGSDQLYRHSYERLDWVMKKALIHGQLNHYDAPDASPQRPSGGRQTSDAGMQDMDPASAQLFAGLEAARADGAGGIESGAAGRTAAAGADPQLLEARLQAFVTAWRSPSDSPGIRPPSGESEAQASLALFDQAREQLAPQLAGLSDRASAAAGLIAAEARMAGLERIDSVEQSADGRFYLATQSDGDGPAPGMTVAVDRWRANTIGLDESLALAGVSPAAATAREGAAGGPSVADAAASPQEQAAEMARG